MIHPLLERDVEVRKRDLGKKAERAEVDREDGCGGPGEGSRGRQQGAVAAQHDDQVGLVCDQLLPRDLLVGAAVGGAVAIQQSLVAVIAQPHQQLRDDGGQLRLLRLGDDGGEEHLRLV